MSRKTISLSQADEEWLASNKHISLSGLVANAIDRHRTDPLIETAKLINAEDVSIMIRRDGGIIWINTQKGCALRVSGITRLEIQDERVVGK